MNKFPPITSTNPQKKSRGDSDYFINQSIVSTYLVLVVQPVLQNKTVSATVYVTTRKKNLPETVRP